MRQWRKYKGFSLAHEKADLKVGLYDGRETDVEADLSASAKAMADPPRTDRGAVRPTSTALSRRGATRPCAKAGRSAYCRRTRVPLIFWLLSVLRKLGISLSISSKYDESAGVLWFAL